MPTATDSSLSRPVLVSTCSVDNSSLEINMLISRPSAAIEQYKIYIVLKLLAYESLTTVLCAAVKVPISGTFAAAASPENI